MKKNVSKIWLEGPLLICNSTFTYANILLSRISKILYVQESKTGFSTHIAPKNINRLTSGTLKLLGHIYCTIHSFCWKSYSKLGKRYKGKVCLFNIIRGHRPSRASRRISLVHLIVYYWLEVPDLMQLLNS